MKTLQDNDSRTKNVTLISFELQKHNIDIFEVSASRLAESLQLAEIKGGYTFFCIDKSEEALFNQVSALL